MANDPVKIIHHSANGFQLQSAPYPANIEKSSRLTSCKRGEGFNPLMFRHADRHSDTVCGINNMFEVEMPSVASDSAFQPAARQHIG